MNPIITFFVVMIVVSVVISILYYSAINNNNNTPPPQSKIHSKDPPTYEHASEYQKRKSVDVSYNTTYKTPNTYVIVDVQTTGLNYYTDSILEITAEKYVDGIKKGNFHSFCKYTKTIPEDAFNINHIFSSDVNNAPSIRTVLNELLYYIKDYPLLTYNTELEMGFLQYNYVTKLNKRINNDVIDGLKLCRDNLPELHDHKLSTVQKHLSVIKEIKHSYNNCKVINHMYQYCLKREESRNKYGVPFSGDPCELNDLEKDYLNEFVKLCGYNKVKRSELSIRKADKYLIVERIGRPLIRFKLNGKLKYFLIDVPYNKFKDEHPTEIECTAGSSSEVGMTRVFSTAPDQMKEFKEYIFTSKNRVWSTQ
jgi:DNA polymerase-3 subunit epsilon